MATHIKKVIAAAFLAAASAAAFAQTAQKVIQLGTAAWTAVLGGNTMAPPVETRWGMAFLTDGRMLNSCTADGSVIWRRGTRGKPTAVTHRGDFFYLVTGGRRVTLVNPSGREIWSAAAPFEIEGRPVVADDGRVVVRGSGAVACFGNNGVRKWHAKTPPLSPIQPFVLGDGSALVFTADGASAGQTVAKRFSQFGEPMEDVVFSDVVDTAERCPLGILVALKDGTMGLISEKDGKLDSPWLQKSYLPTSAFAILPSQETGNTIFLFRTGVNTTAILVRTHSGEFLNQFMLPPLDRTAMEMATTTRSGFAVADSQTALEFAEDGTVWWQTQLPPKDKWSHLCYTKTNTLVLCMSDWVIRGYRTLTPPKAVAYQPFDEELDEPPPPPPKVREVPRAMGSADAELRAFTEEQLKAAAKMLRKGDYGAGEKAIVEGLRAEAERYIEAQSSANPGRSFYAQNPSYTRLMLSLLSETGLDDFARYYAAMIRAEREPTAVAALIRSAGRQGFDPDGEILTAFEQVCRTPAFKDSQSVLKNVCDATFEVCRHMGRPALVKHGKDILRQLASNLYPTPIREYATATLRRLADEKAV